MNATDKFEFNTKINTILSKFMFYSCVLVVVVFVLGNVLNIAICLRENIRKEMMGYYNVLISFWNILSLAFLTFILYFPQSIQEQDLTLISNFSCASINYITRICIQMSAWIHVFLTIDRYLCLVINRGNKLMSFLKSKKRLSLAFMGLLVIFCFVNVPNLYFTLSNDSNSSSFTASSMKCISTPLINQIRNLLIAILRIILPIILQTIFSLLLIYKLYKWKRETALNRIDPAMEKEHRFSRVILWLNLMFIITEIPFLITTLYFSVLGLVPSYPIDMNTSYDLAMWTLAYYVTLVFGLYLFGSLFFVNLLTNKLFQKEIKIILGFKIR
jgi:hypothetical protein